MAGKAKGAGPSWKPDKSTTEGNYGEAVSDAAKAKPKPATPSAEPGARSNRKGQPRA